MAMEPGMITSIEPGLYRPGQWGVRIENLVLNVPADTAPRRTVRRVPGVRDPDAVPDRHPLHRRSLLREDEIAWLNAYHATVRERLAPS
jgi:Xaa-Pro aminopeptidase